MSELSDAELEQALREVGRHLTYPEAELAPLVAARLRRAAPRRRRVGRLAVAVALLTALLAGTAVAAGLGVPGIRLIVGSADPSGPPLVEDPAFLGRRVTLDEARSLATFDIAVLDGRPEVYVTRGRVSLLYPQERLLITQFRATDDPILVKRLQMSAQPVTVAGEDGWWIEGPHEITYPGEEGRRAANTLIWTRDGVTLRLESHRSARESLRIAGSLR